MLSLRRFQKTAFIIVLLALPVIGIGCWDFSRVSSQDKGYAYYPEPGVNVAYDPTGVSKVVEVVYLQTAASQYELVHDVYDPVSGWEFDQGWIDLPDGATNKYTCAFAMADADEKFVAYTHATLVNNNRTCGVAFYYWSGSNWQAIASDYYSSSVQAGEFLAIAGDIAAGPLEENDAILHAIVVREEDGGQKVLYYQDGVALDCIEFGGNYYPSQPSIVVNSAGTPFVAYAEAIHWNAENQWGGVTVARRVAAGTWQKVRLESGMSYPSSFENNPHIALDTQNPDKVHVVFKIGIPEEGEEILDAILYYTTIDFSLPKPKPSPDEPYEAIVGPISWKHEFVLAIDPVTNEPVVVYDHGQDQGPPTALRRNGSGWCGTTRTYELAKSEYMPNVVDAGWRATTATKYVGPDLDMAMGPNGETFVYWRASIDLDETEPEDHDYDDGDATENILSWKNWVYFLDDFEFDYDGWTVDTGTWSITQDETLKGQSSTSQNATIHRANPNPNDFKDTGELEDEDYRNDEFEVTFKYKLVSGNGLKVFLDQKDNGDGLYLNIEPGSMSLRKDMDDSDTQIEGGGPSSGAGWYTIRAVLFGNIVGGYRAKIYRDDGEGEGEELVLNEDDANDAPDVIAERISFVVPMVQSGVGEVELDDISVKSDNGDW